MADKNKVKAVRFERRKFSTSNAIFGTTERPRLSVFRSDKHIYAQIIDDFSGKTLVSAATTAADVRGADLKNGGNIAAAKKVGATIAERAKAAGVEDVVFDRAGNKYHGRIAALADAAREGGLSF